MADVFFVGDTGTATVDWLDANGKEDTVAVGSDVWKSDDPQVATVALTDPTDSTKGATITCVGAGTTKIRVTGQNKADGTNTNPVEIDFLVNSADAAAGAIAIVKNAPAPAPAPAP